MLRFLGLGVLLMATLALLARPGLGPTSADGFPTFTRISAGGAHTCGLTTGGGVKCWGYDLYGQLGDRLPVDYITPADVIGLTSSIASVSAGGNHTCAVTDAGALKCWGYNGSGQLGDGSTIWSRTPVDVIGLGSGVVAVSAGDSHTCALTTAGSVKCWGANGAGLLGDGTTGDPTCYCRTTPVDVTGLTGGAAAVSAGSGHTCALTSVGGVKCWGYNGGGQLGDGTTGDPMCDCRTTPVDVTGLTSGTAAVSAGTFHSCAITTAGAVKCWGFNGSGQLGDGTTGDPVCHCRTTPVDVTGLASGTAAVSAGTFHTCALTTGGGVKCWGENPYGELGNGSFTASSTPPGDVTGLTSGGAAVSAGNHHNCAISTAGDVKCWGLNNYGQLGNESNTGPQLCVGGYIPCSRTPVDVRIDSDLDGCTDARELQGKATAGGERNAKSFWDFYDVWTRPSPVFQPNFWVRDKVISIPGDVVAVARRFGKSRPGGAPTPAQALTEALTRPTSDTGYHTDYDRGPLVGPNIWNSGPPDGAITVVVDVLQVARQFGHSCL